MRFQRLEIRWKAGERKLMKGGQGPMKEAQQDWILVIFDVENKHFNGIGRAALSLFYIWGTEVHLEFKALLLQVGRVVGGTKRREVVVRNATKWTLREMQTLGKNCNLGGKQWNHFYLPHFYHYAWSFTITNLFLWILQVFHSCGIQYCLSTN